jgi:hypothetical protein
MVLLEQDPRISNSQRRFLSESLLRLTSGLPTAIHAAFDDFVVRADWSGTRRSVAALDGETPNKCQARFASQPAKKLVPQTGLEPVTPSLRMTCSTN